MILLLSSVLTALEMVIGTLFAIHDFGTPNRKTWTLIMWPVIMKGIILFVILMEVPNIANAVGGASSSKQLMLTLMMFVLWVAIFRWVFQRMLIGGEDKPMPAPQNHEEAKKQFKQKLMRASTKAEIRRQIEKLNAE